jgi:integrase/recombinase XerD
VLAKTADNRAPATIETIEKRCGRMVAFVGADRDLRSVTVDELRRWIVQMKQGQRGRPTSDIYVEDHRKEAAAFFNWCVAERHVAHSPMELMEPFKITKTPVRTMRRIEIKQLLDLQRETREGIRNRAILSFLYDTGIRVGELARVKLEDVDFDQGIARVHGKTREIDEVPLSPALRAILWKYVHVARPPELFAEGAPLFVSRRGAAVTTNAVRQWMRRAKIKAGIDARTRVSPHVVRASAATHFAVDGASEFMVQRFLRHKDPSMSRKYVKVAELELARQHAIASPLSKLPRGA